MAFNCPYRNKAGNCAGETYNYERSCDFASRAYEECAVYASILTLLSGGKFKDQTKRLNNPFRRRS